MTGVGGVCVTIVEAGNGVIRIADIHRAKAHPEGTHAVCVKSDFVTDIIDCAFELGAISKPMGRTVTATIQHIDSGARLFLMSS